MKPNISAIICSHNPNAEYIERVMDGLKSQTLSLEKWELLLIDNASNEPLHERVDLSWHPHARHLQEDRLGVTLARLCGIQQAQAEVLVFVDDDNVLDSDYLKKALQISQEWPMLGAWGGQVVPEFEEQPPEWTKPYWGYLAIREFDRDKWSNLINQHDTTPYGAGLCVRKIVAQKYTDLVRNDPNRSKLGRTGKSLSASEDIDLAYTACDIGLGTGLFSALKLTHLIPKNRLEEEYIVKLIEGLTFSNIILDSFRGKAAPQYSWKSKLLSYSRRWFLDRRSRQFRDAYFRGIHLGIKTLANQ